MNWVLDVLLLVDSFGLWLVFVFMVVFSVVIRVLFWVRKDLLLFCLNVIFIFILFRLMVFSVDRICFFRLVNDYVLLKWILNWNLVCFGMMLNVVLLIFIVMIFRLDGWKWLLF